jgi:hypothetical protein
MNCERFDERMNAILDAHQSLADDPMIAAHSRCCDECLQKLVIWQQVDGLFPSRPIARTRSPRSRWLVPAAAAALLLTLTAPWRFWQDDPVAAKVVISATEPIDAPMLRAKSVAELPSDAEPRRPDSESRTDNDSDPHRWWHTVEPRHWITQTMPTVRSVQESVAPLSRSFRQAVSLLTFGRPT